MQKKRTNEEWLELVKRQRASGQTVGAWCEANGISRHTLTDVVTRLRKLGLIEKTRASKCGRPRKGGVSKPRFVELGAAPLLPELASSELQVKIGAFAVSVPRGFDEAELTRVCKALVTLC